MFVSLNISGCKSEVVFISSINSLSVQRVCRNTEVVSIKCRHTSNLSISIFCKCRIIFTLNISCRIGVITQELCQVCIFQIVYISAVESFSWVSYPNHSPRSNIMYISFQCFNCSYTTKIRSRKLKIDRSARFHSLNI